MKWFFKLLNWLNPKPVMNRHERRALKHTLKRPTAPGD